MRQFQALFSAVLLAPALAQGLYARDDYYNDLWERDVDTLDALEARHLLALENYELARRDHFQYLGKRTWPWSKKSTPAAPALPMHAMGASASGSGPQHGSSGSSNGIPPAPPPPPPRAPAANGVNTANGKKWAPHVMGNVEKDTLQNAKKQLKPPTAPAAPEEAKKKDPKVPHGWTKQNMLAVGLAAGSFGGGASSAAFGYKSMQNSNKALEIARQNQVGNGNGGAAGGAGQQPHGAASNVKWTSGGPGVQQANGNPQPVKKPATPTRMNTLDRRMAFAEAEAMAAAEALAEAEAYADADAEWDDWEY